MGFVKTPEEVARIEATLRQPRFVGAEVLQIEFLTRPEIVRHVLPPGLEPAERPLCVASIGRWQSNCVGDFEGGTLYVAARHGEIEGRYVLAMFMSTEQAILFGRDTFGEPKKGCVVSLNRRGRRMSGWIERGGVRLIEIDADLPTDLGPIEVVTRNFNVKASLAADGVGLAHDAILTVSEFASKLSTRREGTGALTLRGTPHDPLDEIEIVELVRAVYVEGDLTCNARALAEIPKAEFLPYAYGHHDDWSLLDTDSPPLSRR